jgi:hypothetical protein
MVFSALALMWMAMYTYSEHNPHIAPQIATVKSLKNVSDMFLAP